jgi:hypothetical protein
MKMPQLTSTIEELHQDVAVLRQQNQGYCHQATFSQFNPVPLFKFDQNGQELYLNPTADLSFDQLRLIDARIFLPDNLEQIVNSMGDTVSCHASSKENNLRTMRFP